jgi:hypothetical protein
MRDEIKFSQNQERSKRVPNIGLNDTSQCKKEAENSIRMEM